MALESKVKLYAILLVLVVTSHAFAGEIPVTGKIVSLAPSITETLFAMGLGHRIAGTTEHSDYPPAALKLPRVGKYMNPDLERILALRPKACIGLTGSTPPRLIRMLKKFDVETCLVTVSRMNEFLNSIKKISAFLGEEERGERARQEYEERLEAIHDRVADLPMPRVLTIISVSPLFCAGPDSFISDMVRIAGGNAVGPDDGKHWQRLSRETLLCLNPDIIVFAAHTGDVPDWMYQPPLNTTRIMKIDPSLIVRPTPRLIKSAQKLSTFIHNLN